MIVRNPSIIDTKRGDHFPQVDFPLPIVVSERKIISEWLRICPEPGHHFPEPRFLTVSGLPAIWRESENSLSQSCFRTIAALRQFVDALIHHIMETIPGLMHRWEQAAIVTCYPRYFILGSHSTRD